jgi:1-acyl-sn-glycerol-3-phosphate acyltransferase
MLVAQTEVPVVPCHLSGCFEALQPNHKFPRPHRITLRIGEPIVFSDVNRNREGWVHIADKLEQRVKELGQLSQSPVVNQNQNP